MKVTEHLQNAKNPVISVEIIPPKRGRSIAKIQSAIESILPFNPPFIDITSHAAEVIWEEQNNGAFKRRVRRKSPGTFGICAVIKYKYKVDPVPHILCNGFTQEETEDALIELNFLGVENLFLVRGDGKNKAKAGKRINETALDLVKQVDQLNKGVYLDELINTSKMDFCKGVAAYPEKHFEAPNLSFDIDFLKQKQDAGADYAVTQMFFNNQYYIDYLKKAEEKDISMPIIPGLKILTNRRQLHSIPRVFHINIPEELSERILATKTDAEILEVGVDWAYKQAMELLENGAKSLHFYIMQNTRPFLMLMEKLSKQL